jgi:hypothetical protein
MCGRGSEYDELWAAKPADEIAMVKRVAEAQSKTLTQHRRAVMTMLDEILYYCSDPRVAYLRQTVFGLSSEDSLNGLMRKIPAIKHLERLFPRELPPD